MTFSVIIPARYASSRLPGKPLADIAGKTMIERVYQQALKSDCSQVVIATDDVRVEQTCAGFTAPVCITASDHQSGTDRLHEAALKLGLADDHIVVNVQGDEPLIPPALINQVAQNLANNDNAGMATLSVSIEDMEEFLNPNAVKVVASDTGQALYFSRAPIPWPRDNTDELPPFYKAQRHIGIYAYRVSFLKQFVTWPVSDLEQTEKLEQLRAMSNGVAIHVAQACEVPPAGIDTQEDLDRVRQLFDTEFGAGPGDEK
ncbi:MAG: 3-deoxy-manno-octulosonate cytidylyltransferase (CMP-KDO synthetase) [Pseudomonadales bacterium]|jgi:3-deoxy-manno-octulosonate cytidylyltransferase (CMP-KDO synthetase)